MSRGSADIISALAANNLSSTLATKLRACKMIGNSVHAQATNAGQGITEEMRVKCLIFPLLDKVKRNPQRYYDFIKVLRSDGICEDAETALALLPTGI